MDPEILFSLVNRIYDAASWPERWQDVALALSRVFGGAAVTLALQLTGSVRPIETYQVYLQSELDSILRRHFRSGMPWGSIDDAIFRGRFARTNELLPDSELAHSDFYREWMEPQGLAPEGPAGHIVEFDGGIPVAGIALWRRVGGRPFTEADLRLADALVPHFACGWRLYRRFGGARHERLALAEVMDRLPVGVVLVDRERRPVVSNRGAERITALADGLSLGPDGLHAANARDESVLQQFLGDAIAGGPRRDDTPRILGVSRPSKKRSFVLIISSLFESGVGDAAENAVASVLIGDPDAGQLLSSAVIREFYRLTPAEAELVELLAEGRCLKEAAELRGVTVNTVRSQLKQVFAKTDTRRQSQLIRLVLTGAAAT